MTCFDAMDEGAQQEHLKKTKKLLKEYNLLKNSLSIKRENAKEYRQRACDFSGSRIARYGGTGGGGAALSSAVENEALKHEQLKARADLLDQEAERLELVLKQLDRAIDRVLPVEDRDLLKAYYIEHETQISLQWRAHLSDRAIRTHIKCAVEQVAMMLY